MTSQHDGCVGQSQRDGGKRQNQSDAIPSCSCLGQNQVRKAAEKAVFFPERF